MKRFWDTFGAILIAGLVVKLAFDMIRPYAAWLVVGLVAWLATERIIRRSRDW